MIDLHVHTNRCRHAQGSLAEYVCAARERGVHILAFTDHLPLLGEDETDYTMSLHELPEYVEDVLSLAASHEGTNLEILLGIEADWIPGREKETAALLDAHPFDVVLGSVHFIDDWAFDDPRLSERYEEWDTDALWDRYFDDLGRAAASGLFDVMAHPDLVKKFGIWPDSAPIGLYEQAAETFADADVAVEVSTAGLRKPCAEIYPSETFLRACAVRGVPATIGSDAHAAGEVGHEWEAATALMRRAGYDSAVVFHDRVAEEVTLR